MALVQEYFPELTAKQAGQFAQLVELYPAWNEKINVISRKDIENLESRHILHSLAIAKIISFKAGTKVMDVGTGGGFPGIPLAIFFPDVDFYLVDSIGKKITVVKEIAEALGLKNVQAEQKRAEKVKGQFDFIVSRAVTAFPKFYSLVHKSIAPVSNNALKNGIIYLKGGDFEDEIVDFKSQIKLYSIADYFDGEFYETKKIIHLAKRIK